MLGKIAGKRLLVIGAAIIVVIAGLFAGMMLRDRNHLVTAGQEIVLTVSASAYEDMYGYQFRLSYDQNELEFAGDGELRSKIDPIESIFCRETDDYVLVGALMVGDREGVTGKNKQVCEVVFTALADGMLSDFNFDMYDVNVVHSDLEYIEDLQGWDYKLSVREIEGVV